MGPIASNAKQPPKISEQQILRQSQAFIKEQQLCEPSDDCFSVVRLVIAKISIYGHRHMLDHLRAFPDRQTKLWFLEKWKLLDYQNLDLLFQNLIRRKIVKAEEEQLFTRVDLHEKYSFSDRKQLRSLFQLGEELLSDKKVAVMIFVGSSATLCEDTFDKEFYKEKEADLALFAVVMLRLQEIADRYGMPPTYLFYNLHNAAKVQDFLKSYKFGGHERIRCCVQGSHPILNLNGNICLKSKDSADIIEMPNGPADFYHTSINGGSIFSKLREDKVEYVSCCDCQNLLEMVVDPYLVGLLHSQKQHYDLMYKCTYPENQKDRTFRRVLLQNGTPKADSVQNLTALIAYDSRHRAQNTEHVTQSPVWMNSLVFSAEKVAAVLNSTERMTNFPRTVNFKMKTVSYWSPVDSQQHTNESCYVFEKELSDLFVNHLFRSRAVMVDRQEQYLPVITQKKEYSWKNGYREYLRKMDSGWSKPFYDKFQQLDPPDSAITPDTLNSAKREEIGYERPQ